MTQSVVGGEMKRASKRSAMKGGMRARKHCSLNSLKVCRLNSGSSFMRVQIGVQSFLPTLCKVQVTFVKFRSSKLTNFCRVHSPGEDLSKSK